MALHHTGCEEKVLLAVENETLSMYIKGKVQPQRWLVKDTKTYSATYHVQCEEKIAVEIDERAIGEDTQTHVLMAPLFFEQQNYQIVIESMTDKEIAFDHDHKGTREAVKYLGKRKNLLSGIVNFRNDIGRTDLRIQVGGKQYLTIVLEVFPSKMNYQEDYEMLMKDVNENVYNLSFEFLKSTYQNAGLSSEQQPSLAEFYSILQQKNQELLKVVKLITRRPHHLLSQTSYIGKPKPKGLKSNQAIQYLMKHPQHLVKQELGYTPQKALNVVKEVTYNTKENQWVKYWMGQLIAKLQRLRKNYEKLDRETDTQWVDGIRVLERELQKTIKQYPFREVTEPQGAPSLSMVFQMAAGYKEFYKIYQILQRSLSLMSGMYKLSTKNVAELYEYWCFIKLGMILKEKYGLISQDVVKINHKGIFVALEKGRDSTMVYRHPITKEKFKLLYNPKMQGLPTVPQQPDNVLELTKEMKGITYKYVLDAKYKVDLEPEGRYLRPKEADINTMHRYRDAIVYEAETQGYEKTVFGAVVLFPGYAEDAYKEDKLYKSIETVGIGGLPFLPSHIDYVEDFLDQLIDTTAHSQYEQIALPQGTTHYLEDLHIEKRNVLIGATRNLEQIEGIRKHLIYHIPLALVRKKLMHFEYVALYQGQHGKGNKGGIYEIGKVKHISIQKRKELLKYFPTTSSDLDKEYVVFELESLTPLKKPILGKYYGVSTRMYTNYQLLQYAETLPELHIQTYKELQVYLQIKRMVENYKSCAEDEGYSIQIGDADFYVDGEELICTRAGQSERIALQKFMKKPGEYLRNYHRCVEKEIEA